jgi:Arc/MetJ-type ribon-helix-helix transcriptional regulator
MPRKVVPAETLQFSVTLPGQAVDLIKQLVALGLHGSSRAEVVRKLVLDQLTHLAGQGIVKIRKSRAG